MNIVGVVLAGGQSKRMGTDKSSLKIGNLTLMQHAKTILTSAGINKIFVSGAQNIQDTYINKGPVAGIYACLEHLNQYGLILFIPVDMPLLNKHVLLALMNQKTQHAICFKNQQLPIIIKNNLISRQIIKQQLDNELLSIKNMLAKLNATSIISQFSNNVFTNTNTEKDWTKAKELFNL